MSEVFPTPYNLLYSAVPLICSSNDLSYPTYVIKFFMTQTTF